MAISFDTLKVVEQLENAGFSSQQAKAQASVVVMILSDVAERVADKFATKSDSTQELANLRMELNNLSQEAKVMNSDTKAKIIRWIGGVGVLQMALIAVLALKIGH
ncbi:MAG: CCDC90 family protein [Burkholderiaceae bacterium]|nr:CCDC90 family protein [Burkholderiaceae bacterium]